MLAAAPWPIHQPRTLSAAVNVSVFSTAIDAHVVAGTVWFVFGCGGVPAVLTAIERLAVIVTAPVL